MGRMSLVDDSDYPYKVVSHHFFKRRALLACDKCASNFPTRSFRVRHAKRAPYRFLVVRIYRQAQRYRGAFP